MVYFACTRATILTRITIRQTYAIFWKVWQHRRVLIEWVQDPGHELRWDRFSRFCWFSVIFCRLIQVYLTYTDFSFTESILAGDQKNYHAWQHRQWVLQAFGLWREELNFVEGLFDDDIRFVINSPKSAMWSMTQIFLAFMFFFPSVW